ncbi:transcriptional regulator [Pseudomonas mosselii]|uniref:Helix-turn-helix domain-containing protein n=1 Tax=Pseudomonas mosselii TaxID=78327 RepID=A0A7W2PZA1_9PSED|nr:Cro/CI family transcriptional regulator [Pseudomonas mosselii]MBA6066379.1 helix-turn-helix domain-containing protein [Pseudomonas mosselii]
MTQIFKDLVLFFGGQVATAKALGVTQGTVSGWVRGVHGCSADMALVIQVKTKGRFTAAQFRPSLAASLPTLEINLPATSHHLQTNESAVNPSSVSQVLP